MWKCCMRMQENTVTGRCGKDFGFGNPKNLWAWQHWVSHSISELPVGINGPIVGQMDTERHVTRSLEAYLYPTERRRVLR